MDLFALMQNQIGFFLLILVRISGIFSAAPIFGARNVPLTVKAGLALIISYILFPIVFRANTTIPDAFLPYVFSVVQEFLVGLILGYMCSFIFYAVQMAGQLLDMQVGFGMVNVIDPQFGQQVPLIGNFKYILALIVFLSSNGHHILLSALFNSFKLVPVNAIFFRPADIAELFVDLSYGLLVIALKLALPVLVAILLTDVALGILARTMPQMNVFVIGVPAKILAGIFVLSLALPAYIAFLEVGFNDMYANIYRLLALLQQ